MRHAAPALRCAVLSCCCKVNHEHDPCIPDQGTPELLTLLRDSRRDRTRSARQHGPCVMRS